MSARAAPDFGDVQPLVLRASRRRAVRHQVLHFTSAEAGRAFLVELADLWPNQGAHGTTEMAIGLTFRGLEVLDVPEGYLHVFRRLAPAFAAGAAQRGARLGDSSDGARAFWEKAFHSRDAHALLTVHGDDHAAIDAAAVLNARSLLPNAVQVIGEPMNGAHLLPPEGFKARGDTHWVHFGYRDGLAGPHVQGDGAPQPLDLHEPGELLLGEPRDLGDNPWSLVGAPAEVRAFFRHGSFGALRKIEQHEDVFRAELARWARYIADQEALAKDAATLALVENFVRAKLCGRWPSGHLVQPQHTPTSAPFGEPERQADFSGDAEGRGCPLGSHLRRMNPRGQGVALSRLRPLFRRGMPYGRWFDDAPADKRGLLGLFFCSDLEGQFEHLLGEWADRPPLGMAGAGDAKDPLVGAHEDKRATLMVPRPHDGRPAPDGSASPPWSLHGFTRFVRTCGTLYAFYPALGAVNQIAGADWIPEEEPWPVR